MFYISLNNLKIKVLLLLLRRNKFPKLSYYGPSIDTNH